MRTYVTMPVGTPVERSWEVISFMEQAALETIRSKIHGTPP
mgnify:CR=1 FL=1